MNDEEWSELTKHQMANHITTYRRDGLTGRFVLRSPSGMRRASDYGRRRLALAVLAAWAVGVGSLLLVQAALAFWQGVGR